MKKNIKPLICLNDDPELHKAFMASLMCCIENQIQSMGAIKGLVIRKTYSAVKSVKPGYAEHIVDVLSREYVKEFSDLHETYRKEQNLPAETITPLPVFMKAHDKEVKDLFWKVADGYAQSRTNTWLGKTYQKFKPTIAAHLPTVLEIVFQQIEHFTMTDADDNGVHE